MKNSGVIWIGMIPEKWDITKSKYVVDTYVGNSIKDEDKNNFVDPLDSDIYLSSKNIISETSELDLSDVLYIKHSNSNFVRAHKGDILMCIEGGSAGKKKAILNDSFCFVNKLCCFHPFGIDSSYLFFVLDSPHYENEFNLNMTGMIGGVSRNKLNNFVYPLPPVDEQKRIAKFLIEKTNDINRLIKLEYESIDKLKEYKDTIIKEVVTHGLSKNISFKNTNIEWAPTIPSHWRIMPNKYVMKKKKEICNEYKNENIISLSMNGVLVRDLTAGGKMPSTFDGYQYVYPGNLLMCLFDYDVTPRCIGLIKDLGITSPAYSQFEMENNNNSAYYYYYYLMIDTKKELLHLAKNLRHSFTEDEIGRIETPVPPIEEQKAISEYLDLKCREINSLIDLKKKKIDCLVNYKKTLTFEYVTGKKEVVA